MKNNISLFWNDVQHDLKNIVGESSFNTWLSKLELDKIKDNVAVLKIPNKFQRDRIVASFLTNIEKCIYDKDNSIKFVEIQTEPSVKKLPHLGEMPNKALPSQDYSMHKLSSTLHNNMTFKNFIVSDSNELVHVAAKRVVNSFINSDISQEFNPNNPLYIYGKVGLGKTHILQSIAHEIKDNNSGKNIIYLSSEKFMELFIRALKDNKSFTLRDQIKAADILLVDDLQFITTKECTMSEFMHICQYFIDNNKRLVIAADRPPRNFTCSEKTISLLDGGLAIDIESPELYLRKKIIRKKAENASVSIPEEVTDYLALNINYDIRRLEGALNLLITNYQCRNLEINLENTKSMLNNKLGKHDDQIKVQNQNHKTIKEIQKIIAAYYNVSLSELISNSRNKTIVRVRQIAIYYISKYSKYNHSEIAVTFKRTLATIPYSVKKTQGFIDNKKISLDEIADIDKKVNWGL